MTIFPLKIAPSHGEIWTPIYITWFPGFTWVLNPNDISIGSAVFAELTSVTQTDHASSVGGNSRPHLRCSTAMRPKNGS